MGTAAGRRSSSHVLRRSSSDSLPDLPADGRRIGTLTKSGNEFADEVATKIATASRRKKRLSLTPFTLPTDDGPAAAPDAPGAAAGAKEPKKATPLAEQLWLPDCVIRCIFHLVNLAALINVIFYPVIFSFGSRVGADSGWFGILLFLDVVLWLDVVCVFFTPLWVVGSRKFSHRTVALKYLKDGRIAYDLVCRLPWDLFFLPLYGGLSFGYGYGHLARLLLAPRTFAIVNDPFGRQSMGGTPVFVNPARRLSTLMWSSIVVIHCYACITWLVTVNLEGLGRTTWLSLDDGGSSSWADWPWWARYARALEHALLIVMNNGVPDGVTHEEVVLGLVGLLGGIVWLAYFTSTMVHLVTTLNQSSERALEKISAIKTFCQHANLTPELRGRVMSHLEYVLLVRKLDFDWKKLLFELSEPLRAEVSLQRCKSFLLNPKFIGIMGGSGKGGASPQFIKLLVARMQHVVFSPGDFCIEEGEIGQEVFFLSAGVVAVIARKKHVASLKSGDCFGEIALLLEGIVRTASIVASAFCEAHKLSRIDFSFCLRDFPEMAARIKKIAEERLADLNKQLAAAEAQKAAEQAQREGCASPSLPVPNEVRGRRRSFSLDPRSSRVSHNQPSMPMASAFAVAAAEAMQAARRAGRSSDSSDAARSRSNSVSSTLVRMQRRSSGDSKTALSMSIPSAPPKAQWRLAAKRALLLQARETKQQQEANRERFPTLAGGPSRASGGLSPLAVRSSGCVGAEDFAGKRASSIASIDEKELLGTAGHEALSTPEQRRSSVTSINENEELNNFVMPASLLSGRDSGSAEGSGPGTPVRARSGSKLPTIGSDKPSSSPA